MSIKTRQPPIKTSSIEVATIYDAMVLTRGNQSEMSRMLDMDRGTFYRYLKEKPNYLLAVTREHGEVTKLEMINKG